MKLNRRVTGGLLFAAGALLAIATGAATVGDDRMGPFFAGLFLGTILTVVAFTTFSNQEG